MQEVARYKWNEAKYDLITNTDCETNTDMENNTNFSSEQTQTSSELPTHGFDFQETNEERFTYLQDEMFTLKAMMENLIQQNEERDRQTDASATTSSFAVRASNMYCRIMLCVVVFNE